MSKQAVEKPEKGYTRRSVSKAVTAAGATVILPSFATVAVADTDSGNVEVNTVSTIPTDCSIHIRVFEDTSGDGTADRSQEEELIGGTTTTVFDVLQGYEGQSYQYWVEASLAQNTDGTSTPELDSLEIVLPADEPEEPEDETATESEGFTQILDNPLAFIAGSIMAVMAIGMGSKSMALASWGGYLMFAYFAIHTGYDLLENILYVTLVLIFIGFAFKFWRLEGMGE